MTWTIPQPFETVDHTADTGVRAWGRTREEALARLVLAHAQLLTGGIAPTPAESLTVEVPMPADAALLAVDTLREMHQLFSSRKLIAAVVTLVELAERSVRISITAGPYDARAHAEGVVVKAVTYHAARFEQEGDQIVAQVILDV